MQHTVHGSEIRLGCIQSCIHDDYYQAEPPGKISEPSTVRYKGYSTTCCNLPSCSLKTLILGRVVCGCIVKIVIFPMILPYFAIEVEVVAF